jgi:hypothetical protein
MSTNRRETVTLTNLRGISERVTLPAPHWEGKRSRGAGVWTRALYVGPRTGRMFLRADSIWDRGDGITEGTVYRELDPAGYLEIARTLGIEPIGPAGVHHGGVSARRGR